jgi:DNA-binding NarL/FixJ family response regulator
VKILLVDDQPSVRQGLRMLLALDPDMTIVGEAGDGATALELAASLQPDVVVMDVVMPGMDGLTAAERLHTLTPGIAIVILSLHDDPDVRARATAAGAAAYVGKGEAAGILAAAIRAAGRPRPATKDAPW